MLFVKRCERRNAEQHDARSNHYEDSQSYGSNNPTSTRRDTVECTIFDIVESSIRTVLYDEDTATVQTQGPDLVSSLFPTTIEFEYYLVFNTAKQLYHRLPTK